MNRKALFLLLLFFTLTFSSFMSLFSEEAKADRKISKSFRPIKKDYTIIFPLSFPFEGKIVYRELIKYRESEAKVSLKEGSLRWAIPGEELSSPARSSPSSPKSLPKGKLYFSIPLSALLGYGGFLSGLYFGYAVLGCSDEGTFCEHAPDNAEFWLSGGLGLIMGSSLGAYLGGLRKESRGSYLVTLLGATLGYLPILVDQIIPGGPNEGSPSALSALGFVGAPICAALANNMIRIRRGKKEEAPTVWPRDPKVLTSLFPVLGKKIHGLGLLISF